MTPFSTSMIMGGRVSFTPKNWLVQVGKFGWFKLGDQALGGETVSLAYFQVGEVLGLGRISGQIFLS